MRKIIYILLAFILLLTQFQTITFAQTFRSGENIVLAKSEAIQHDYFASGGTVTVSGIINGDAYVAGGTVLVDGVINGDLLVAGGTVNVNGTVSGNIRLAGGTVTINGQVGKNITLLGGTVIVENNAHIGGNITAAAGTFSLAAPAAKNVTVASGTVTIATQVAGEINAATGNLELTDQAKVNGNVTYWSKNSAAIAPEATISGKLTHNYTDTSVFDQNKLQNNLNKLAATFKAFNFISLLLIGILFLWLLPNFILRSQYYITSKTWISVLIGFIFIFIMPVIFILLMVTLFGIPLALLLILFYIIVIYFSSIFVSTFIGEWIFRSMGQKTNQFFSFITGLLLLNLLSIIPVVGGLINFFVLLLGSGVLLQTLKDSITQLQATE